MAKYFTEAEFACKGESAENIAEFGYACGCGGSLPDEGMHPLLLTLCDKLREKLGQPIRVNSGYRCEEHNRRSGGETHSYHMVGVAADLTYDGIDVEAFAQMAEETLAEMGIEGGVGRYPTTLFVHVDVRGYTSRW